KWDELKPDQRDQFVSTFKELLERNYVKQVRTNLDYEVVYKGEKLEGEEATVQSTVKVRTKGKSTDAEIDYRMHKVDDHWMVYDVITDELSLVRNYRSQFTKIMTQDGYDGLLKKIRKRVEEQTADDGDGGAAK